MSDKSTVIPYGNFMLRGVREAILALGHVPYISVVLSSERRYWVPTDFRQEDGSFLIPVGGPDFKDIKFDDEKAYIDVTVILHKEEHIISVPTEQIKEVVVNNGKNILRLKLDQWTGVLLGSDLSFYHLQDKKPPKLTIVK